MTRIKAAQVEQGTQIGKAQVGRRGQKVRRMKRGGGCGLEMQVVQSVQVVRRA